MIIPTPKLRIWMTRENFESMSRRRLLRKMASLGVSGGALQFLTGETVAKLTEDPEKNVPRLKGIRHENPSAFTSPPYPKSPKWVPEFYTIPRQKWVEVESARKAEEKNT